MDILTAEERSRNMSAIRSKDTKPEVYLRKLLFAEGLRYRKNITSVYGHPDLWLAKYRTAIFVHGCFWHRHPGCRFSYHPKSRIEFWQKKFEQNIQRDTAVRDHLQEDGIRQLVIWECTVKEMKKDLSRREKVVEEILAFLKSGNKYMEI